ncbi:MFS transporter [Emcibacter sp. SYSU 3D8]|uniref:MFS transporter n=1 Tax=Emcibacter sp. SYSU 3D8 TaxID=3133969 RepID=UPI0031FF447B
MSDPSTTHIHARWRAMAACGLLVGATITGMTGIDLVLPAIPILPDVLGGTVAAAQLVIAAFVAGIALGLLVFGALGDHFDRRSILGAALAVFAALSFACARAPDMETLIALRFLQGLSSAAAAVLTPGMIRGLFDDRGAVQAIGVLGSLESLVPALAPIAGSGLLAWFGWRASFEATALLAFALAAAIVLGRGLMPGGTSGHKQGSYRALLRDRVFLRYTLSQAFTLGGLLIFVFGAPAVFVRAMGGELADFIVLQLCGVTSFIMATTSTGRLVGRFGTEQLIWFGTALALVASLAILAYGLAGGMNTLVVTALFVPMNLGLGLRGPPGFLRAIVAARGDDARGAALLFLAVMAVSTAGTALLAPFIMAGLPALAGAATAVHAAALMCLVAFPPLELPAFIERRQAAPDA